uniref:F-box domain-containing protein n=1 Tax=Xiphophorus couchianus TaxID=32473 RepID=A0A3B5LGX0_9TELE
MTTALQLPNELWLQVFSFLSWKDKLSMRCTCSHFKQLLDECRPLWNLLEATIFHVVNPRHHGYTAVFRRGSL